MKRYKIAIDKSIWRYNTHETILDNDARVLMCVIHFHLSCVANQFAGHSLSRRYDRGQGRTAGLGLRQWETIPCKQRGVFCHRRSPVKEKGYFGLVENRPSEGIEDDSSAGLSMANPTYRRTARHLCRSITGKHKANPKRKPKSAIHTLGNAGSCAALFE